MNVAIIPARGGSKRIPRKNIKVFCSKPMIAWSIEAALENDCFDQVIVSTDDQEITDVARSYGAEVLFKRPTNLADDHTGVIPVIAHAVELLQNQGVNLDWVCCLFATSPFIEASDIQSGLELISKKHCDYVFSVTSFAYPIQRAIKINAKGQVEMFYPEYFNTRSQDLEESYHDAGQFYWGSPEVWRQGKPIFTSNSLPVLLPWHRVHDIDTPEDWGRAELMFKALKMNDQTQ